MVVNGQGGITHRPRSAFVDLLHPGDLVIANDAATMPARLYGRHRRTGCKIEARLAARDSLYEMELFSAVIFGDGDYRTPTEDRPAPPPMRPGDWLDFGSLQGTVSRMLHPRLVELRFSGSREQISEGLATQGKPIQYAHLMAPLALWDTWTAIAGPPVAFEPPSAGFALTWNALAAMRRRQVAFATITHAAGISSTGDPALDALLPFDEPYRIPLSTAWMIQQAMQTGGRVIAIGTTVVRALEHSAADFDGIVPAGEGLATQRIGASTELRVVDALLSGTHERGTSHYELLRAFADDEALGRVDEALVASGYRTHEFGDSVFLERLTVRMHSARPPLRAA